MEPVVRPVRHTGVPTVPHPDHLVPEPRRVAYTFGTGDGNTTTWQDPADLDLDADGLPDAIALDFDGDGRVDDAMWDSDGDGTVDTALLDLDDDGAADHGYTDPTGLGTWNGRGAPLPGVGPASTLNWTDPAGGRHRAPADRDATAWVDFDADGDPDELARDLDRDGTAEQVLADTDRDGRHETAYLDVDADGHYDLQLVDADGDGRAEDTYREGDPGFDL